MGITVAAPPLLSLLPHHPTCLHGGSSPGPVGVWGPHANGWSHCATAATVFQGRASLCPHHPRHPACLWLHFCFPVLPVSPHPAAFKHGTVYCLSWASVQCVGSLCLQLSILLCSTGSGARGLRAARAFLLYRLV